MRSLSVHVRRRTRGILLLLSAAFLLAIPFLMQFTRAQAEQPLVEFDSAATLPHSVGEPRHFYITTANLLGDAALDTCAEGYHFASLWEILDVNDLKYAEDHPAAKVRADQGDGPAAGWWGWVRTGVDAYTGNSAGQANCNLWASSEVGDYGTIVRLDPVWTDAAVAISPWETQTWSCAGTAPVWCVSDPVFGLWLPTVIK